MKANELMIGDWADLSDVSGEIIPCKVVELHIDELFEIQPHDKACDIVGYDMVRPIPLNSEILKKNGFKKVGSYEWQTGIKVTRWRFYSKNLEYMVEVLYAPKYDGFTWKGCNVNSVHLLQHALRLCGLNDLADNFKVD